MDTADIPKNSEAKRIIPRLIEDEMKSSYLDYAMSVIIGRALPDVRDGLKPVHRRILFAMNEMGMHYNKPFKKSARIVGEVLGKYHPHGDSAVYDALVRMAQSFSLRYPLIDGQGNFGSIDGDNAAAMRYTEARLKKIAQEMLQDIDKETVNFIDNFDGSLKEPTVLPGKLPNLLVNGSSGIAVGMATNVPPHNLKEISDLIIALVDNPELELQDIIGYVKGPDFPTGGIILGNKGIQAAYATGHGKIRLRSKTKTEEKGNKKAIVITEIPYMVNKSMLIEEIAKLVKEKIIEGISDIRDESDKTGIRVVLELKKDANKDIITNQLFKHTRAETTFSINLLALNENKPELMSLKAMALCFIKHRKEVIRRKTEFELRKAKERAHILEGLKIALENIDEAVRIIKGSGSVNEAKSRLAERFGLTEKQSQAILDMKLQKLTSLETEKIIKEHAELLEKIKSLQEILASDEKIKSIIKDEAAELKDSYGDERKTEIVEWDEDYSFDMEDLIKPEEVVVTITKAGYIKRTPLDLYKTQKRGGKGIIAATTKEEDIVEHLFVANTHDYILLFTDNGKVYWLKVYRIPEAGRYASGKAIVNLLEIEKERKITAFIKVKEFDDKHYLFMATEKGIVKKTGLKAFSRPRVTGIKAIGLAENDKLINVVMTDGDKQLLLATENGSAVKFHESCVRPMGRPASGVRGIKLRQNDKVIGMVIASDNKTLFTITENGYGKRTKISDYRRINRGGYGVRNIICSERNGKVVGIKSVTEDDQLMLISKNGIIIRIPAEGISVIGRNTQGVRVMRLSQGDKVVSIAKVILEKLD